MDSCSCGTLFALETYISLFISHYSCHVGYAPCALLTACCNENKRHIKPSQVFTTMIKSAMVLRI